MKASLFIHSMLLASLWLSKLSAQDDAPKWDVEIPLRMNHATPAMPAPKADPINFKILNSLTARMDVTEAAEMPDLPPITGTINATVQLVEDPHLPDPPPPLPALAPDDPAVLARFAEMKGKHRGIELVFFSATVYDHNRTLVKVYPRGNHIDSVTAWSNIDFNHLCGISTFRVKDQENSSFYDYGFFMGISNTDTRRMKRNSADTHLTRKPLALPEIPIMPDEAVGGAHFEVVEGNKQSQAYATLEQIHLLYRKEGKKLQRECLAREKAQAARKAFLLANPQQPKDVTIQFWHRETPSPSGLQNLNEQEQK
jgi:hypothetical protein